MKLLRYLFICILPVCITAQNIVIVDSLNNEPIPFATISFGNGLGNFADDDGMFTFSAKKYTDIDSLYISAMGYTEKAIAIDPVPEKVRLRQEVSQLSEVVVSAPKEGKFKTRKRKATTHSDIFACWLPTVESEVAVLFKRTDGKPTQIARLLLPINAETQYKSKGKGAFPTLFRIQFYENKGGLPGMQIGYEEVVFSIPAEADKVFDLNVAEKSIFIPENGLFASLQVLGYTNKAGRLAQTKKYREVKTPRGVQKISTSFRPLLPFTKETPTQKTYVRRIFFNNKKWQVFDKTYNKNSKLIQTGHRNYNMGAIFKVYEN